VDPSSQPGTPKSDPWSGWDGQSHPNAPSGGGGPGRFKTAGSLGTNPANWHGVPHPLAPAARYLAVADVYCELGAFPNVRIEEEGGVYFVSLTARAAMRPFLRTRTERFQNTVKRVAARSQLAVVVNGNMYDFAKWKLLAPSDPARTTPEGIVRGRGAELGGTSEPLMFYVAWSEGPTGGYRFGHGDPPGDTTSAIGGLGPVILGGRRYGSQNKYKPGVPSGAPPTGEPGPAYEPFLEIRSNRTYESFAARGAAVGKVIIGFGAGELPLRIVVQRDGIQGLSLDDIRDRLFRDGVQNAVFLDGSDSAMLFANGRFYVQQGTFKDSTNTVGIGFQVPCSYMDAPGRSLGHIA